jgi:hypothetical protein
MKKVLIVGILVLLLSVSLACAVPFDGKSDVNIINYTGQSGFGYSLATSGDLNGDGYADLVVGAGDREMVFYGGPGFDGTFDVNITSAESGYSLATAGDLNNDGYADLVVGAPGVAKAFVYYGGPSFDDIPDWNITDHTGESYFGSSLATSGDLNNDGYADLVIGAVNAGNAFVYYGGSSFDNNSDINITNYIGETGFGRSVANAGDLNGDGYADLVVGAYSAANKAFVFYGGPSFDNNSDWNITNYTSESGFGASLATSGDLDGDGYADLVIGAYDSDSRKAFVFYGGPSFDNNSDVNITDHTAEENFGISVATSGDLNNDGYADLIVGASGAKKAFVYYGGSTFNNISDVNITDHRGVSTFGWSLATSGDLNNDGYADLVVGSNTGTKVFVYYGVDYPLKSMSQPTIVTLQGKLTNSTTGIAISTGSMRVTVRDNKGNQVWQSTFNNVLSNGVFNIPLGAAQELRLIPGIMYRMVVDLDADAASFSSADVTFGDNLPAGDLIKFTA